MRYWHSAGRWLAGRLATGSLYDGFSSIWQRVTEKIQKLTSYLQNMQKERLFAIVLAQQITYEHLWKLLVAAFFKDQP